LKKIL